MMMLRQTLNALIWSWIGVSAQGWKNALVFAWYDLANPVPNSDSLPAAMFSPNYEIHHGGCVRYSMGTTEIDVTRDTIGQRFIITCSVPDYVRDATTTFNGVEPGTVATYIFNPR
ncbi:hypothetical protein DPMN_136145 [Dreissena polymorpha]|uniref:Uncharacterized protein n=1 Tax=Dreissena polymorpha TaxID=45954 RepID=A0A9D4G588_DREPO|nr:hypothetical protein DPMN_136145 [Dreissena polymorpha]